MNEDTALKQVRRERTMVLVERWNQGIGKLVAEYMALGDEEEAAFYRAKYVPLPGSSGE